jgi:hypothetical protein
MRRECQEILPGLLLGPLTASKSLNALHALKITHMYYVDHYILSLNTTTQSLSQSVYSRRKGSFLCQASVS